MKTLKKMRFISLLLTLLLGVMMVVPRMSLAIQPPSTATLHVIKHVINDNYGTAVAGDFNLHVKTSGSDIAGSPALGVESPGTTYTLAAGTYVVSEDAFFGYTVSYSGDSDSSGKITLAPGDNKTVTLTNNDMAPAHNAMLHVIKHVINDNGGTADAGDFNLHVKTTSGLDIAGSPAPGVDIIGTTYAIPIGTYVVSEDTFAGYTVSYSGDSDSNGVITLKFGDNLTVTITNNDNPIPPPSPATLHVIKHVINDNGGTAVAANFTLHVKDDSGNDVSTSPAPGVEWPGTTYTLAAGTYVVNEDFIAGYTLSYSGASDSNGNITLAPGDNKNVYITNNDNPIPPPSPATLHVIKHVINDNGGTAVAANFTLHVKDNSGNDVSTSPAPGVESPGTSYTLAAGTYVVNEDFYAGYALSYSGDSDSSGNITLAPGDNKTVTITNNDMFIEPPSKTAILHVIKHVINDDGRTAIAGNFNLHVKDTSGLDVVGSPAPGVESPGTSYTLDAGTYVVSEDVYAGYTVSYSGNSDNSGKITLKPGDNLTVTLTNNDIPIPWPPAPPAILHVIKHVINDSGGTAVAGNFTLYVKNTTGSDLAGSPAPGVESPGTTYTLDAGTYVVSEEAFAGYTVSYSGNSDNSGKITLKSGDNLTVTLTNDDISVVVDPPVVVTSTITGGQLPKTSTHLYELLLIGVALMLVGAVGWRRRKRYE